MKNFIKTDEDKANHLDFIYTILNLSQCYSISHIISNFIKGYPAKEDIISNFLDYISPNDKITEHDIYITGKILESYRKPI